MNNLKQVSIILPTFNERNNIIPMIKEIKKYFKNNLLEILVVDDDSPDKTWEVVKKSQISFVIVFRRKKNRGVVFAKNFGIKKARGNIIGWMDADFSHPPKYLPKMLKKIQKGADVVVASRYVKGGKDTRDYWAARFFSRIINYFARILLFEDFTDYTSCFILGKKQALAKFNLVGDYGEYFARLIFDLKSHNFKVKEIPYNNVSRQWGKSKTSTNFLGFFTKGYKYVLVILQIFVWKWWLKLGKLVQIL